MQFRKIFFLAILSALGTQAHAIENIEMNSFLSVTAAAMNEEGSYLDQVSEHITFENDSHYGINIRTQVSDRVDGAAQLLATSTDSNFNVQAEWAYVSYKLTESTSFRGGMLNLSTFLLSDYSRVGYLYPWIRPPVEVYENNPLKNFLGLEWLHVAYLDKTTKLTSQFFIGSAQVEQPPFTFKANDGYGVNFQLDTPSLTFRIGAISPVIQLDAFDSSTGVTSEAIDLDDRGVMYTVGASVDWNDFVMYTEAVTTDTEDQTQAIFPNQDGAYLTLGYRFGKLLPHITFGTMEGEDYTDTLPAALIDPNTGIGQARPPVTQDSITLGLRYDLDDSVALKFEVMQVELEPGEGDGFAYLEANDTNLGGAPGTVDSYNVVSMSMDVIF